MEWFFCVKSNHRVSETICEGRKARGACIVKRVTHGRGSQKVVEEICAPAKKKSQTEKNEMAILEMAINGKERG